MQIQEYVRAVIVITFLVLFCCIGKPHWKQKNYHQKTDFSGQTSSGEVKLNVYATPVSRTDQATI